MNKKVRQCLINGNTNALFHVLYIDPVTNTVNAIVESTDKCLYSVPVEEIIFLDTNDVDIYKDRLKTINDVELYLESYKNGGNNNE